MIKLASSRVIGCKNLKRFIRLNLVNAECWLAGGALRTVLDETDIIQDYDLFFKNQLAAKRTELKLEDLGAKVIFKCPQGKLTTLKLPASLAKLDPHEITSTDDYMKIQLVTENYYSSVENLLNQFDVTPCRFAYDGTGLYAFYSSIRDVKKKRLGIHAVPFPMATMRRIEKYINKGYKLTRQGIERFVTQISETETINGRFYID